MIFDNYLGYKKKNHRKEYMIIHNSTEESISLFTNMSWRNKTAFALFILAKAMGMCGVLMGFIQSTREIGGWLLLAAFVSIIGCLVLAFKELSVQNKQEEQKSELINRFSKEFNISKIKAKELIEIARKI